MSQWFFCKNKSKNLIQQNLALHEKETSTKNPKQNKFPPKSNTLTKEIS